MSIKQNGGVFGRNPTFNDVTIEGDLIINGEVFTGLDFQGSWNASTNTPALASSTGTNGEFYIVSVAGSTDLNGITNWGIGDWAIFNGTAWQRVEGGADGNFNDLTVAGSLSLGDNVKANFGAGDDLQIYHDGNNSRIYDVGTGDLRIQGTNLRLMAESGENYLYAVQDAWIKLYYNGLEKLATTSTGIDVTGVITTDGMTTSGNVDFGDSDVARFGAGNDLQIYHDGANSYIEEAGTGSLFIRGTNLILEDAGGNDYIAMTDTGTGGTVEIKHNAVTKLATTATGIDVTGTATMDGLTVDGDAIISGGSSATNTGATLQLESTETAGVGTGASISFKGDDGTGNQRTYGLIKGSKTTASTDFSGGLDFFTRVNAVSDATKRIAIASNGDINFYEDTGTTAKLFWDASEETLFVDQKIKMGNTTDGVVLQTSAGAGSILGVDTAGNGWNDLDIRAGSATQLYLDTSNNVGIGTDSPSTLLHLQSTDPKITLTDTSLGGNCNHVIRGADQFLEISADSGNSQSGSVMKFNVDNAEAMRIDSSGSLLVGTIGTPNGTSVYGSALIPSTNDRTQLHMATSSTADLFHVRFYNPNGAVGDIRTSGSATAYNTSSDYRLKEDVQAMSGATDRLKELKPVNFAWKADGSRVDGFIAHEAQEVVPESVTGSKDAMQTEEYEVSPATGDIYTPEVVAVEGVEAVEYVAPQDEVLDEDGNVVTEAVAEVMAVEAVEAVEGVAEVIHSANVEQPSELEDGQLWRETTAQVMGEREVPDYQGIDQAKLVPLLVATIQELEARITALES